MGNYINIRKLTIDELAGVVTLYPWYGAARLELCRRMSSLGGENWGKAEYAAAALYVCDRQAISDIYRSGSSVDYSDKDLDSLLKSYIREDTPSEGEEGRVRVVGGDYFSQAQYEKVRKAEDSVFSKFASKAKAEARDSETETDLGDEFCTETLAQIYADQGYYDQAKHIYSRLSLNIPEKNAYFASLIEKIEELENK